MAIRAIWQNSLFVILAISLLLASGCNRIDRDLIAKGQAKVSVFLSSLSAGATPPASLFAKSITVTRVGGEFDETSHYTPESYVSFWRNQFSNWRPQTFTSAMVHEYQFADNDNTTTWFATLVVYVDYVRSDNSFHHSAEWTFETDYHGKIRRITIK